MHSEWTAPNGKVGWGGQGRKLSPVVRNAGSVRVSTNRPPCRERAGEQILLLLFLPSPTNFCASPLTKVNWKPEGRKTIDVVSLHKHPYPWHGASMCLSTIHLTKDFYPRVYKVRKKLSNDSNNNIKATNNWILKWPWDLNRHFSNEEMQTGQQLYF